MGTLQRVKGDSVSVILQMVDAKGKVSFTQPNPSEMSIVVRAGKKIMAYQELDMAQLCVRFEQNSRSNQLPLGTQLVALIIFRCLKLFVSLSA